MTLSQPIMPTYKSNNKFQHHTHPNYNNATTTILNVGHRDVKRRFCQRYILLIKAPKAHITGQQYMDHTCNMIQMIEIMKGICWHIKHHGDVSIAIGAFADMDRLPDFDEMVAHPALLVPQKIPVDKDAILPYIPNLVEAILCKFNATLFVMAHKIPLHELQARAALHIWPHSIKISPDQSDPYDIPNDLFCNSKILSQNCMSKLTKEDNDASLLAMENHLFDRLFDAMKYQSQAMYAFMDLMSPHSNEPTIQENPDGDEVSSVPPDSNEPTIQEYHHLSNYCDNMQPLHNSFTYTNITPPHFNEPTIQ
jgi:hypothetical protein